MAFAPSCRRKDGALTAEPLTSRVFARPEAPVSPISTASGRPVARPASAQAFWNAAASKVAVQCWTSSGALSESGESVAAR